MTTSPSGTARDTAKSLGRSIAILKALSAPSRHG
ncbi:MAG TPA: IclR family transcriptional regulator, partial [Delftia acidovorans]|nr:IclR family transcriptional regulator [Delftia acidovorans]